MLGTTDNPEQLWEWVRREHELSQQLLGGSPTVGNRAQFAFDRLNALYQIVGELARALGQTQTQLHALETRLQQLERRR